MRYKAMFAAGLVAGFIAGARAGRERYDQLIGLGRKIAGHPAVQKTTQAATAKAAGLAQTAAAKAPGLAKTATAQVPKITAAASAVKQQASGKIPFAGKGGANAGTPHEEATGTVGAQTPQPDGSATASYNGVPSATD